MALLIMSQAADSAPSIQKNLCITKIFPRKSNKIFFSQKKDFFPGWQNFLTQIIFLTGYIITSDAELWTDATEKYEVKMDPDTCLSQAFLRQWRNTGIAWKILTISS
jgi:hypothetical protein